jgi:hypothetical protein
MSNTDDLRVWVGDLDGYINIDAISRANEREAEEEYLHDIGEIQLLAGKVISSYNLSRRGITAAEWRWAIHEAERALHNLQNWGGIEALFIKDLLSLGKRYAIARYAKWERITYAAALTATFSHGFMALLDQFLNSEKIVGQAAQRSEIRATVQRAFRERDLTAYHRAGMVQSAIHQSADGAFGPKGYLRLNREGMRTILSLARLHYSVCEIGVKSLSGLQHLDHLYENARLEVQRGIDRRSPVLGRQIQNWELRHLHPLTYLYPFSIRHAIARGLQHHEVASDSPNRTIALNELALARCGIMLMRRKATDDAKQSSSGRLTDGVLACLGRL